jgi:transposase
MMMIQAIVGIDISKDTFDATLLFQATKHHEKFQNDLEGYKKLNNWLKKHQVQTIHACMEATGQYSEGVATYLYQQNHQVSVVNPARIKAYGNSKLRRNKTDKADSELIAEYCLRENPSLWSPPPASFKDLQALIRRYDDLMANYQQEMNRLKSGYSTPSVVDDIRVHKDYLKQRIKLLKKAIMDHIKQTPELKIQHALLTSIIGIGDLTAAKILGEVRNIIDFSSARQLKAYAGLTPRNFFSGTSVHKKSRISKTGNTNLRKALYMSAICAKKHNPIVRDFCDQLLKNGKCKQAAVCAAMGKLLQLAFGVLKSGIPFDPNYLTKPSTP